MWFVTCPELTALLVLGLGNVGCPNILDIGKARGLCIKTPCLFVLTLHPHGSIGI